jgi:hypothetical protein
VLPDRHQAGRPAGGGLLTSGGVPAQPWDPPSEILEPRTGPRLTWDDLLDLHLELELPDWWARFQAACR